MRSFLLRVAGLALGGYAIAGVALTLAADRGPTASEVLPRPAAAQTRTVTVPNLEGQVYVFAKSMLEDAGFAWKVRGKVRGFAPNIVVKQSPKPGTVLVDTGAPTIVLTLARNPKFRVCKLCSPDDFAPYHGTPTRLAGKAA